MIRRPPRSTLDRSSAASDVYKRQAAHVAKYEHMGHREVEVASAEPGDDTLAITIVRQVDIDVPGVAKKFINPVSYTHLRAHETVLDLVCRLLLDKKHTHTHTQHTLLLTLTLLYKIHKHYSRCFYPSISL